MTKNRILLILMLAAYLPVLVGAVRLAAYLYAVGYSQTTAQASLSVCVVGWAVVILAIFWKKLI